MNMQKIAQVLGYPLNDVEKFLDCFFALIILKIRVEDEPFIIDKLGTFKYDEKKQILTLEIADSPMGRVKNDLYDVIRNSLVEKL